MEKGKIIFEKRFPKLTLDDYEKLCENLSGETAPSEWDEPGAFYKKLVENMVRIAIPDRIESSSFFIALAKEIALSNQIRIQRGLTTSSVSIFVPFISQELFQGGEALYYGLNATSGNMILADRNIDYFVFEPNIHNLNDLGWRYLAQHLDTRLPPELLDAIDPVPFGQHAMKEEQGHFTEHFETEEPELTMIYPSIAILRR